jgi:hypothetical protein
MKSATHSQRQVGPLLVSVFPTAAKQEGGPEGDPISISGRHHRRFGPVTQETPKRRAESRPLEVDMAWARIEQPDKEQRRVCSPSQGAGGQPAANSSAGSSLTTNARRSSNDQSSSRAASG